MKTKLSLSLAGLAFAFVGLTAAAPVEEDARQIATFQRPSYPLATCIVSGKKFDETTRPVEFVHKERLFLLASDDLAGQIEGDFEKYAAKLNAAVIERQKPIYPVDTCIVSGEGLGSMGNPVELVYGTRLVRLCCKGCRKAFYKEPAKFIRKIDQQLIEHQRANYPFEICLVSNERLGSMGEPIDRLHGVTLVRLCCKGCVKAFEKRPQRFVAKIVNARARMNAAQESGHKRGEHGDDHDRGHDEHGEDHGHDGGRGEHGGNGEHGGHDD